MSKTTVFRSAKALRQSLGAGRVGLVPTMGALHEGHLSLVRRAKRDCKQVLVSIFVNPTQFGPKEDFKKYPRDLKADLKLLDPLGGIKVFAPSVGEIYPEGFASTVKISGALAERFEAEFRPGHFDGVATVVARLFGLLQPDKAYFGLKDFQQFKVIQRMTADLSLPVELLGCETLREADGLAMSSRNRYLNPQERAQAPALQQALKAARAALKRGQAPASAEKIGKKRLKASGAFRLQYLAVADAASLGKPRRGKPQVIVAAAMLGATRLIDNLKV